MSEVKIHGLSAEGEAYRAALVAIQELHKPMKEWAGDREYLLFCVHDLADFPCATRRLADDALTARTTKNGDNK